MNWFKRRFSPASPAHLQAGETAELKAERYLQRQGLRPWHRNYRCRRSELDLVMHHNDFVVFVEVRHRRGGNYGGALASVTARKQQRLLRAASEFLVREKINAQRPCRFDVVAIEGDLTRPRIHWIPNAFDLDRTGA